MGKVGYQRGSYVTVDAHPKSRRLQLIDRAPKGWWALDVDTREMLNLRRYKGGWEIRR